MNIDLLIGGQATPAKARGTFERLNPVTGGLATVAAAADVDDANYACQIAAEAFPVWSQLGPSKRRDHLLKAAEVFSSRTDEFIHAMVAETGATPMWAGFNVMLATNILREAAGLATQMKGETIPSDRPGKLAMGIRQPAGVVLGIAPWNAPIILGVRAIAAPLALGNTVILKASEQCPRTHHLIVQTLHDAGIPAGVVNVVTNKPADAAAVVGALIAHPAVRRINFTGSTEVGRKIASLAGQHLKPVLLELGGKAPMVVLDDADLDEAVNAAAFGAFFNQGQICMSTERLIVSEKIADAFVAKLRDKAASLTVGPPTEAGVHIGAMVGLEPAQRLEMLTKDARDKGAHVALGGAPVTGVIVGPTIIDKVAADMKLYREESFGPIVAVIRARDDEHAIELANDTDYGLSAAVFSQNIDRALNAARRIRSGICHINGPTVQDEAQMPFGGMGASGYGRFGGSAAIAEFTDLRWVSIDTGHQHYPF
jgi:acyl-CoA reductase-like NAD-dependent aldehyde dehydrogenase